jgi:hypothetical protein
MSSELSLRRVPDSRINDPIKGRIMEATTLRSVETATNVVVLFSPPDVPREQFERTVAEWSARGRAVLVVFPSAVDAQFVDRLETLGADLCITTPTSTELFTSVDRARALHRRVVVAGAPS